MIVMKFGGTSVADAHAMRQVCSVVNRAEYKAEGRLVVLSACSGITSRLLMAAQLSGEGLEDRAMKILGEIEAYHLQLCDELILVSAEKNEAKRSVMLMCAELRVFCQGILLLRECTPRSFDFAASFGELLSTMIFSRYLNSLGIRSQFYDARKAMRTNSAFMKARPDMDFLRKQCAEQIQPLLRDYQIIITQGFIGSDEQGNTTTLGRGGSDFSAALFGAALSAREIQIWTDVSGIASADPRKVPDARWIETMSFAEARELAYYGAKVLHPETILPAIEQGITVKVLNTFAPEDKGTAILPIEDQSMCGLRSVITLDGITLLRARPDAAVQNNHQAFADFAAMIAGMNYEIYAAGYMESHYYALIGAGTADVLSKCERSTVRMDFQAQAKTLLCACGPGLLKPEASDALHAFHQSVYAAGMPQPLCLMGISGISILAAIEPATAARALNAVHGILGAQIQ
jgi:aspartate kinase